MINLKRIMQISVFISLVLPIILMMYLTSLFGMSFEFKQWFSAIVLDNDYFDIGAERMRNH